MAPPITSVGMTPVTVTTPKEPIKVPEKPIDLGLAGSANGLLEGENLLGDLPPSSMPVLEGPLVPAGVASADRAPEVDTGQVVTSTPQFLKLSEREVAAKLPVAGVAIDTGRVKLQGPQSSTSMGYFGSLSADAPIDPYKGSTANNISGGQ